MPTTRAVAGLAAIAACGAFLLACGKSTSSSAAPAPSSVSTGEPAKPFSVAGIFPPGTGREKVLETCGSCHSVVCCTRGQRTAERWDNIQKAHKDKLTGHAGDDVNAMFAYLKANFNETKPEPQVPADLLQQGCTPF
jgi:cytochrome c5